MTHIIKKKQKKKTITVHYCHFVSGRVIQYQTLLLFFCHLTGINGKLYANLHGLEMVEGERVVWYLFAMGNEGDIHTVHFHAVTFTYKVHNMQSDSIE